MKSKKTRRLLIILIAILIVMGYATYYLVSVQKMFSPVEVKYGKKTPSFSFIDTIAYPPASGGTFYIKATTKTQQSGTCTFVLTKGNEKRIEVSQRIDNEWACELSKPYSFYELNGDWDVFVLLKNTNGKFATKTLRNVSIDSNYKPKEVTFTSVKDSYQKDADGTGLYSFRVTTSENVTGECYFYFFAEQGKSIGGLDIVERRIKVDGTNTCSLDLSAKDFKAKGWYTFSLSFNEPYNQYRFKTHDSRVFIWY